MIVYWGMWFFTGDKSIRVISCHYSVNSQGHNFYKLKYISLEEVKIVPFQQ